MRPSLALLVFDAQYRKVKFYCGVLLYLAVLVFGSLPGARVEVGEWASGLVLHLVTYSLIAFLLFDGIDGSPLRKAFMSFLIVAAMGAIDEYVQSFFPYRFANVMDWVVDINAGLFMSVLLWWIWPKEIVPNSGAQPRDRTRRLSRKFPH